MEDQLTFGAGRVSTPRERETHEHQQHTRRLWIVSGTVAGALAIGVAAFAVVLAFSAAVHIGGSSNTQASPEIRAALIATASDQSGADCGLSGSPNVSGSEFNFGITLNGFADGQCALTFLVATRDTPSAASPAATITGIGAVSGVNASMVVGTPALAFLETRPRTALGSGWVPAPLGDNYQGSYNVYTLKVTFKVPAQNVPALDIVIPLIASATTA